MKTAHVWTVLAPPGFDRGRYNCDTTRFAIKETCMQNLRIFWEGGQKCFREVTIRHIDAYELTPEAPLSPPVKHPLGTRSPFGVADEPELITCTLFDHSDDNGFSPPLTTLLTLTPNCSQPFSGLWNPPRKGSPNGSSNPPEYRPFLFLISREREMAVGVMESTPCFSISNQVLLHCLTNYSSGGPNGGKRKEN